MSDLKVYEKLTHVLLKDGRVLVTDKPPIAIYDRLIDHSHIMIDGEMHSKFSIVSATEVSVDALEGFILNQPTVIRLKLREKAKWLKDEMGKEMTLEYAKNYVLNLFNKNEK